MSSISSIFGFLAFASLVGLIAYVAMAAYRAGRGLAPRFNAFVALLLGVLFVASSVVSQGVVVIDATEVGVVFNDLTGLRETPLREGVHIIIPFIERVTRFPITKQAYTMTRTPGEGAVAGDDTLWSRTRDGQQVGLDATVIFRIDPNKAVEFYRFWKGRNYVDEFIRPVVRSVVRHYVSAYGVEEIYGPSRRELQEKITEELTLRFAENGFILDSFDIRNIHFTDQYAQAIENKQVAQQEAERMKYVLEKEQREAERKKIEAEGVAEALRQRAQGEADAKVIAAKGEAEAIRLRAQAEAEALRLINEALAQNQAALLFRYIDKLAPNVRVMLLPSNTPFLLDLKSVEGFGGEALFPSPTLTSTGVITP